jgi:tetratricopeptide (TPR) repeat protein
MGSRTLAILILTTGCATALSLPGSIVPAQNHNQSPTRGSKPKDHFESAFRDAQDAFNRGDYPAAARGYERALAIRPDSPEALSNLGVVYHMQGNLRLAVETMSRALAFEPGLLPANLILGIDLVQLGKSQKAIAPLERVLDRDSRHRDALLALASANFGLHKYDEAAEIYQREINARPDDADAWYGMGLCFEHIAEDSARNLSRVGKESSYNFRLVGEFLTDQGSGIDAEEAFRLSLALSGKHRADDNGVKEESEGLNTGLGFALLSLGDIDHAADEFRTELRLYPGALDAKLGLAALSMEKSDFVSGFQELCAIHSIDSDYLTSRLGFFVGSLAEEVQSRAAESAKQLPTQSGCSAMNRLFQDEVASPQSIRGSGNAFQGRRSRTAGIMVRQQQSGDTDARLAWGQGRYGKCSEDLEQKSSLSREQALLLSRCACLSGRFWVALEASNAVLGHNPHDVAAIYWQSKAGLNLARAAFQCAVSLSPNSWQGHVLLGDIYRQRKKWDLAISHYEAAAQLKPTSPAPFLGLATLHWQTGENERAEAALRKVLELEPDNEQANFELGDIEVRRHHFDMAIPYLKKGVLASPDLFAAHADLGKAYAALGKDEEAVAELTRALSADRYGDLHYQLYVLYKKQGKSTLAQEALAESQGLRAKELHIQQRRLRRALDLTNSSKESQK